MNRTIDIMSLNTMPIESILNLYRQGYRIDESRSSIFKMGTCPTTSFDLNSTHSLVSVASLGTPPYTYKWTITKPDGTKDTSLPNLSSVSYTFSMPGNYVVEVYVTDSCPSGAKQSPVDSCTVSIIPSTSPTPTPSPQYHNICQNNVCTQVSGSGIDECSTIGQTCGGSPSPSPPPIVVCKPDDINIIGTCIPKKYAIYGGIGFGAILLLKIVS